MEAAEEQQLYTIFLSVSACEFTVLLMVPKAASAVLLSCSGVGDEAFSVVVAIRVVARGMATIETTNSRDRKRSHNTLRCAPNAFIVSDGVRMTS